MKYLAIVKDVWTEAWARRTVITLACLVVFFVGLYGWGISMGPHPFNDRFDEDRVMMYFFDNPFPEEVFLRDLMEYAEIGTPRGVAQGSMALAFSLLVPWGIIFGIILTTGFFRDTLRPQKLYWILSKPISRIALLLSRFGGAVMLVAVPTLLFVVAIMVFAYWKTGVFISGAFGAALIAIFQYISFAAVALLLAVWTRSTPLSTLIAIILYFTSLIVQLFINMGTGWFPATMEAIYYILPKTSDLGSQALFMAIDESPFAIMASTNFLMVWGSSVAFTLVALALGLWKFQREDY